MGGLCSALLSCASCHRQEKGESDGKVVVWGRRDRRGGKVAVAWAEDLNSEGDRKMWEQNNRGGGREGKKGGDAATVMCAACTWRPQC